MKSKELIKTFENLLSYASRNTCLHEETYPGGTNWEICSSCGMRWADDEGGKPKNAHKEPKEITDAHLALTFLKMCLDKDENSLRECTISGADMTENTITVELNAPNSVAGITLGGKAKILIE